MKTITLPDAHSLIPEFLEDNPDLDARIEMPDDVTLIGTADALRDLANRLDAGPFADDDDRAGVRVYSDAIRAAL